MFLLITLLGSFSCATTPTQDGDFAIYGEEPEGPGVASDEAGEIVFSLGTATNENTTTESSPSISTSDAQEFNAFKRWLKAKQDQDQDYQEFQQWLKYEQYRQLQEPL